MGWHLPDRAAERAGEPHARQRLPPLDRQQLGQEGPAERDQPALRAASRDHSRLRMTGEVSRDIQARPTRG